jgi:hypothetical protein
MSLLSCIFELPNEIISKIVIPNIKIKSDFLINSIKLNLKRKHQL